MRSSSITSTILSVVAWFSLGCHPQAATPGASRADSNSTQAGAIAGSVVGDSSLVRRVPVEPLRGAGDTIAHLTIALSDEQSSAPPALLVIVAPDGKQTGMRPTWTAPKEEIPGANYYPPPDQADSSSEPPLDIAPQLMVGHLVTGQYRLLIFGAQSRPYLLLIRAQRQRGRPFGVGEWNGQTALGKVDTVLIDVGPGLDTAVAVPPSSFR